MALVDWLLAMTLLCRRSIGGSYRSWC